MRRLLVASLLLVGALSGCLSEGNTTCEAASCASSLPTTQPPDVIEPPPGVDLPPLPVNETLRTLRFEDCFGASGGFNVPQEPVHAFIPDDFTPYGDLPGMDRITINAISCDRLVLPDRVVQNYRELRLSANVVPKNESWAGTTASFFTLDRFVSDEAAAGLVSGLGFPARQASFDVSLTNLGGSQLVSWKLTNEMTAISFAYLASGTDVGNRSARVFSWAGENPYLRMAETWEETFDQALQVVPIIFDGDSTTASLLPAPAVIADLAPEDQVLAMQTVETDLYHGGVE